MNTNIYQFLVHFIYIFTCYSEHSYKLKSLYIKAAIESINGMSFNPFKYKNQIP